MTSQLIRASQP